MNEGLPQEPQEEYKIGVKEALESGKVGFSDMSLEGMEQLLSNAPENQVFLVPDERFVTSYTAQAEAWGRSDVTFEVAQDTVEPEPENNETT